MKKNAYLKLSKLVETLKIEQLYTYENSTFKSKTNLWAFHAEGRIGKQRNDRVITNRNFPDEWQMMVDFIKTLIPSILYFPNFLFDFPDKIYLEDYQGTENKKHEFYRDIAQDILHSISEKLDLETHVLDRAKSGEKNDKRNKI